MSSWQDSVVTAWQAMSYWELAAVVFAIAYLLLALKQSLWCWYAALASSTIYLFLFWDVNLLMESALQIYYVAMAVFGWYQWKYRVKPDSNDEISGIHCWTITQHLLAIGSVVLLSVFSGYFLSNHTSAALPYLDSFTTWGAVLTTWMVTRKVLENWIYWIVIDSLSIYLCIDRGLYLTALLLTAYLVICVYGWQQWYRQYADTAEPVRA